MPKKLREKLGLYNSSSTGIAMDLTTKCYTVFMSENNRITGGY